MKAMRYANEVPVDDLYIPHGSDESTIFQELSGFFVGFISHMVQMKGGGGRVKDLQCSTLYPTWFR